MEIVGVSDMHRDENSVELFLDVVLDRERALTWQVSNPRVWIVFNKYPDNLENNYLELLDGNLSVHGFEFLNKDIEDVMHYIKANKVLNLKKQ